MRLRLLGMWFVFGLLTPAMLSGQARWVPPKCDLKPGHSLVNNGLSYLKNATTRSADQREKNLSDANRTLVEALTSGGQEKNPAAWYYLGRYYVLRDDVVGADSAFRKSENLFPACKDDIVWWRRNALWVPAFNAGVEALNAQNNDSAIVAFRRAAIIYDGEPQTFSALAAVYFNTGQPDSAAIFFRRTVQAASAPGDSSVRRDAIFNLGNAFYMAHQYDSAAAAYGEFLKIMPNDAQALTRLGDVLASGGHEDSAMSVYREIIAHADSVEPVALINTGVSVYNAAPPWPDTATISGNCRTERRTPRPPTVAQRRAITAACDSVALQALTKRNEAARVNYELAARAFEFALQRDSMSRDGLYNLSNTYLALHNPDKMLAMSVRLVGIDPMSRHALRLVAQAWQLKGFSDSALHYVTIADSLLPVEISIGTFTPGDSSARVSGTASNFHETASAPMKVVFEFLSAAGTVVATESFDLAAMDAGGTQPFQVKATGVGIVAWRYRKE